ncbi:MAG: hypothetical protein VW804_06515, partial [Verrucomicrobiota bacterium]
DNGCDFWGFRSFARQEAGGAKGRKMGMTNMLLPAAVPCAADAEKGAIGACILGAYQEAVGAGVAERHFWGEAAKTAWRAMAELAENGHDINEVNV